MEFISCVGSRVILYYGTKVRIFDVASGQVILVSHHPGKNPYDKLDPLGLGNTDAQHAVHGGRQSNRNRSKR